MEPKKCDYSKIAIGGFLSIAIYSFYCGSWLLSLALIFIVMIHIVDVRRKNRIYQKWVDRNKNCRKSPFGNGGSES